ncbi:MAG: hypothetical protein GY861_23960 [bacterium]|nr:hypothetical protein [bacterium]
MFLHLPVVPKGHTAKLMHLWRPYRVIECHYPNLLVKPCNNSNAKSKLVNIDQVKPGPPDNRTTYSLPSLRLPEEEEPDEKMPSPKDSQEMTDKQLKDEQQIHKPQPLIDESVTEQMPINPINIICDHDHIK